MYKRIFLLTIILLAIFPKPSSAEIIPIYPEIGSTFTERTHVFVWENTDTENEYLYHIHTSHYPNFLIGIRTYTNSETSKLLTFTPWNIVYWKIYYQRKDLIDLRTYRFSNVDDFNISDVFVFGIGREVTEEILLEVEEINRINREKKEQKEEEVEEENIGEIVENITEEEKTVVENVEVNRSEEQVLGKKSIVVPKIVHQESEFFWNISPTTVEQRVKKIEESNNVSCKFKHVDGRSEVIYCNIPKIVIQEEKTYPMYQERCLLLNGEMQERMKIQVDEYECRSEIFKPLTWFKCSERYIKTHTIYVYPNIFFRLYNGYNNVGIRSFSKTNGSFSLYSDYFREKDELILVNTYLISYSKFNISHRASESYKLMPEFVDDLAVKSKPFIFPFQRLIGVTQWYGNTAYQQPHRGIDFGAREENVLAIGDGEVVAKGWDSYNGNCFSGGNYLKVKQSNGMYTIYFHLNDMYVNTGQRVSKGDVIAQSGNSGAWNCQPLGYHLHLETRLNHSYESHSNPVQHIDADWASVPTLGYDRYPGRLTGENPHPGR